ncbi:Gfo/Idh/MocA family protein [Mycobacterium vicinigordonae]|uniref:Gfo/Idh/MocA family oxidoreductase n=1 Tax=Mycobacterium vicinigordonae TaxID=1719132 RepID=A0A7D6HZK2_9MYCO|nr:Gfo/Idh/MocA family oxidoreductase [Mycobacterium vicinigordonae]QLL08715.1 Gfo/Idh/MocA family oxidoreductase [Mycobacterium vicinigordonae]
MRIGIIGAGYWSRYHAQGYALLDDAQVVSVCDLDAGRAKAFAEDFGIDRIFYDPYRLIEDDELDVVDIVVPPPTHLRLATAAIDARKHVLCEKPMAMTAAEANEMAQAAITSNKLHAIGFQRRYDPAHRCLRQLVQDGYVGETRYVSLTVATPWSAVYDSSPTHRWVRSRSAGGGFMSQVMVHWIDLARFVFGDLYDVSGTFRTVGTVAGTPPEAAPDAVDDVVVAHASLPTGGVATLSGTWSAHHATAFRWEVYGSEGTLRLDTGFKLYGGKATDSEMHRIGIPSTLMPVVGSDLFDIEHRSTFHDVDRENFTLFGCLARDFVDAIADRPTPRAFATFSDGARTQEIIESCVGTWK